jgi:DNA-binding Xre family transcriptional regulator
MSKRRVRYNTDLAEELADRGITLSRSQLSRLVNGKFSQIRIDVLEALCGILECRLTDLIVFGGAPARVPTKNIAAISYDAGVMMRSPRGKLTVQPIPVKIHGLDEDGE